MTENVPIFVCIMLGRILSVRFTAWLLAEGGSFVFCLLEMRSSRGECAIRDAGTSACRFYYLGNLRSARVAPVAYTRTSEAFQAAVAFPQILSFASDVIRKKKI
jgi:hypothetical protein